MRHSFPYPILHILPPTTFLLSTAFAGFSTNSPFPPRQRRRIFKSRAFRYKEKRGYHIPTPRFPRSLFSARDQFHLRVFRLLLEYMNINVYCGNHTYIILDHPATSINRHRLNAHNSFDTDCPRSTLLIPIPTGTTTYTRQSMEREVWTCSMKALTLLSWIAELDHHHSHRHLQMVYLLLATMKALYRPHLLHQYTVKEMAILITLEITSLVAIRKNLALLVE